MSSPLPVLIVAEDALTRAGLAALLADEPAVTVVGRVAVSDDLPAAITLYQPAVLLWDLGWNPQPALERLIGELDTMPPVAALLPDATYVSDAWLAGVRGLLRRDATLPVIAAALLAVAEGLAVVDPDFVIALQAPPVAPSADRWRVPTVEDERPLIEALTAREHEVLRLLAEGLPNKTIAQRLGISEHTVKFHVNAILGKLGASSRTEAVVRATRLGLLLL